MNIRNGKFLLATALATTLAALLAIAAYWYWSPLLAIRTMQRAAVAHDAEAFNSHVDYPRLRDSLKAQLASRMGGKLAASADAGNPLAALGASLGRVVADTLVDAMVRPELVMRAMRSGQFDGRPAAPDAAAPATGDRAGEAKPAWNYVRLGADKLLIYAEKGARAPERNTGIVFERSGFATWKLTQLRLPAAD